MKRRMIPGLVLSALAVIAVTAGTATGQQQVISLDVRGAYGFGIGDFGEDVNNDFGFGGGMVLGLTPLIGLYGGWARDSFGCDDLVCSSESRVHVSGFEAGAKFTLPARGAVYPWLKAGMVAQKAELEGEVVQFESDRHFGFQAVAGLDFPLGPVLSMSPSLRLNWLDIDEEDFFADLEVRYLSVDIGGHVNIPMN